jgi:hypothetical protein
LVSSTPLLVTVFSEMLRLKPSPLYSTNRSLLQTYMTPEFSEAPGFPGFLEAYLA